MVRPWRWKARWGEARPPSSACQAGRLGSTNSGKLQRQPPNSLISWSDCAICAFASLCYNTAMLIHHAETTLNWGAARRLVLAGLGILLLWGAVWWAIQ